MGGCPASLRLRLSLPSSLWQPPPPWARCRGQSRRVAAGASLEYRYLACQILRSAASGRIAPIFRGYTLCLAVVSLPRHGRIALLAFFFSSSTDLRLWKSQCWFPIMRNRFSNSTMWCLKKRMAAALRTLFSQLHACLTALHSCASLLSVFRRCQTTCFASVTTCSSASVWASPLQPRPGLLRSRGGIASLAARMMAAVNATSTSFTQLSPGGFVLSFLPTAVSTSSIEAED